MNTKNELIKDILLKMNYNSRSTLSENKSTVDNLFDQKKYKNLLTENEDPITGQKIPVTMNQILQFQKYIWNTIEKDLKKVPNTCRSKDKKTDCAYNSIICPKTKKPCWKKDAIDGLWGGSTTLAWNTYKEKYKKYNPEWWIDDALTQTELTGQQIPVTVTQTKNFQKWYLEQIEKAKPNQSGLYTTKLCAKPCKYSVAVDGILGKPGSRTRSLWDTYSENYKKSNVNWYVDVDFDEKIKLSTEKVKKIAQTFVFTVDNPSGYNGTSPITNVSSWLFKNPQLFKLQASDVRGFYNNYGWDVNPKVFPTPREYTESDFSLFIPDEVELRNVKKEIEQERQEYQIQLQSMPPSDRLGTYGTFETQQRAMLGQKSPWEIRQENWDKRLLAAQGPQYNAGKMWNKELKRVKSVINEKCSRALSVKIYDKVNGDYDAFVSFSDVCYYAGGLWVYNVGEGPNVLCGCRFMEKLNGLEGEQIGGFQGPKGPGNLFVDWGHNMAWSTPGGKGDAERSKGVHNVMTIVELGLLFVGIFSGPAAPIFFGLSSIAGFVDAGIYFAEGDKYMGTMLCAVSLLGLPEIATMFKSTGKQALKTLGKEGLERLAKKEISGTLTALEKTQLAAIKMEMDQSAKIFTFTNRYKMVQNFVNDGIYQGAIKNKWGFDHLFSIIYNISQKVNNSFVRTILKIGGIVYTTDQVYMAIYGNDEDRKYSAFGPLLDWVYGNDTEEKKIQAALKLFEDLQKNLKENASQYLSPESIDAVLSFDPSKLQSKEQLYAYYSSRAKKNKKPTPSSTESGDYTLIYKEAPELSEIKNGEVASFGSSGNSITEIQQLLIDKGYNEVIKNGKFDDNTQFYVFRFQEDNKINPTGFIDSLTLNFLLTKGTNCSETIESLKNSGWQVISKVDYTKKSLGNLPDERLTKVDCNNTTTYLYDPTVREIPRSVGQSPVLTTVVDNPDYIETQNDNEINEIYQNFKRFL